MGTFCKLFPNILNFWWALAGAQVFCPTKFSCICFCSSVWTNQNTKRKGKNVEPSGSWISNLVVLLLLQVMVKRQRTAFPPNFVHSLDGSHMMMTAVACKRAGLKFAGFFTCNWILS